MPDQATTIEALQRLQPHRPADSATYVERSIPARPPWNWPGRLALLLAGGQRPRILLHGAIGVGKTTELHRWAESLPNTWPIPVRVSSPADGWDASRQILEQARRSFMARTGIAADHDPYNAADSGSIARSWSHWTAIIRTGEWNRPPVLLVDGLDLIAPDRLSAFFGPGTPLALPELPAIVITAPNALLTVHAATERDPSFDPVVHIPPFPVVDETGARDDAVCDLLADGLLRRLDGTGITLDLGLRRLIAAQSGGVPRDALRIVTAALIAAVGEPEVRLPHVLAGVREVRQDLEQSLTGDELVDLRRWSPGQRRSTRADLIRKNAVLVYEGSARRYERPHPLLSSLLTGEEPTP